MTNDIFFLVFFLGFLAMIGIEKLSLVWINLEIHMFDGYINLLKAKKYC
jgi:hypothetical protein